MTNKQQAMPIAIVGMAVYISVGLKYRSIWQNIVLHGKIRFLQYLNIGGQRATLIRTQLYLTSFTTFRRFH